jgi:ribosomal-protein-alanine N-acetyltransferase
VAGQASNVLREGERVCIRHPVEADRAAFVAMVRASRELHEPWVFAPSTPERFDAYRARLDGERHEGLLVCTRDTGDIVGVYNVMEIVRGVFLSAYIGVYGNAAYAGQGLMSEGLRLVLAHCFRTQRLHRVEANIQPGNEPSRRLFAGAGFRQEGFSPRYLMIAGAWRDHERWALTVEDWGREGDKDVSP